jgi:hypothetical protein
MYVKHAPSSVPLRSDLDWTGLGCSLLLRACARAVTYPSTAILQFFNATDGRTDTAPADVCVGDCRARAKVLVEQKLLRAEKHVRALTGASQEVVLSAVLMCAFCHTLMDVNDIVSVSRSPDESSGAQTRAASARR